MRDKVRQTGYYWVQRMNGVWAVGHYHDSGMWRLTGEIMNYYDKDFSKIGTRIPNPAEDNK